MTVINREVLKHNNGIRHAIATKLYARSMRTKGFTHREISNRLGVSVGTAFLWTQDIKITARQKRAIEQRRQTHHWSTAEQKLLGDRLKPYQYEKRYTKQSLIKEIINFHQRFGRIPLKQEFNSRRSFRTYFGSWNNAIAAAGFKPNPVYFSERTIANDGHSCDSTSEKIIDDWLYQQNIKHERAVYYKNSRMTADFYLPKYDKYIELFGLKGAHKEYDSGYHRKLRLIRQLKLDVIKLNLDDVMKNVYPQKIWKRLQS